eukprot:22981-Pleurochrysis_carterae.AAC.2
MECSAGSAVCPAAVRYTSDDQMLLTLDEVQSWGKGLCPTSRCAAASATRSMCCAQRDRNSKNSAISQTSR